jgi:hypothetical protein
MRSHHLIAIMVVILVGIGVKMLFFPNPPAEAASQAPTSAGMDVLQMHLTHPHIKDLPEQRVAEPF